MSDVTYHHWKCYDGRLSLLQDYLCLSLHDKNVRRVFDTISTLRADHDTVPTYRNMNSWMPFRLAEAVYSEDPSRWYSHYRKRHFIKILEQNLEAAAWVVLHYFSEVQKLFEEPIEVDHLDELHMAIAKMVFKNESYHAGMQVSRVRRTRKKYRTRLSIYCAGILMIAAGNSKRDIASKVSRLLGVSPAYVRKVIDEEGFDFSRIRCRIKKKNYTHNEVIYPYYNKRLVIKTQPSIQVI